MEPFTNSTRDNICYYVCLHTLRARVILPSAGPVQSTMPLVGIAIRPPCTTCSWPSGLASVGESRCSGNRSARGGQTSSPPLFCWHFPAINLELYPGASQPALMRRCMANGHTDVGHGLALLIANQAPNTPPLHTPYHRYPCIAQTGVEGPKY